MRIYQILAVPANFVLPVILVYRVFSNVEKLRRNNKYFKAPKIYFWKSFGDKKTKKIQSSIKYFQVIILKNDDTSL